ncbi:chitooligosaccharide deacetylase [Paenibacillus pectinilyticus]|uniref:Chitooligosaccharide deacetylase n=1 Tax=Paenibacillus pectinilyticus TaxID=512399 RepID=A0A1C1A0K4_9BACL|nr:chitooligosaccharide deacetylase [Paenibacillus pectinilyticus]
MSQKRLSLSQLVVKYPDTFKLRGSSQEKKIALTFDDGPDTRFTPKVLDALKANGVKATFFVLGSLASTHPDIIQRIVHEGHVIGNHSYSHANLPKLSVDKFQNQIERTDNVLQGLIGYAPRLIRPPYGAINEEQVRWMADHHYLIVNWNVDSLDWKSLNSDQVLHNIIQQTKPGSIILQHSGGADSQDLSGTVQAIGPLVSKLKAAGYTFVTVPELLHVTKSR